MKYKAPESSWTTIHKWSIFSVFFFKHNILHQRGTKETGTTSTRNHRPTITKGYGAAVLMLAFGVKLSNICNPRPLEVTVVLPNGYFAHNGCRQWV